MTAELTAYDQTRYCILAALAQQNPDATFPQSYTVQPQITVTLFTNHLKVSTPDTDPVTVPTHIRDGRLWLGTWADEDHLRARLRAIDDQRTALGDALTDTADNALALSARTIQDNFLLHYLPSYRVGMKD